MRFGTAILLAGGKSLRMGFDKQSIKVEDRYLVQEIAASLHADFSQIIAVTNEGRYYEGLPITITKDVLPSEGPLSGIHAGLLLSESEYAFVLACDMPYYCRGYSQKLRELLLPESAGIITSLDGGKIEPFHGYYHKSLVHPIEEALASGKRKIRIVAEENEMQMVPISVAESFSPERSMFQNLNTESDLREFLEARESVRRSPCE